MKGIELPINVLVVVAVAVIVLLGVVGLFFAGFIGGSSTISLTAAKNNACAQLIQRGCGTTNPADVPAGFDANGDGSIIFNNSVGVGTTYNGAGDNLQVMCERQFGVSRGNILVCKRDICACPGL